jgi:hypothetical protein
MNTEREAGEGEVPPRAGDVEERARAFTLQIAMCALSRLDELSRSEDEKVAFTAIQEILNRAFGKVAPQPPRPEGARDARPVVQVINYADWLEQQMEKKDA